MAFLFVEVRIKIYITDQTKPGLLQIAKLKNSSQK